MWGQHKTHLKNASAEEQAEHQAKGKLEKCCSSPLLLKGASFLHAKEEVEGYSKYNKKEKWGTKKMMLNKFTEDELDMHLASGRVLWRDGPKTWGCWEYMDTGDISKETSFKKGRSTSKGVEYAPDEEEFEAFGSLWDVDGITGMHAIASEGKGQTLAKGKAKGKGKGKPLTKGKGGMLALEDGSPEDTDETMEQALRKAKRARDLCSTMSNDIEEALQKAKSRMPKSAKEEVEKKLAAVKKAQNKLKDLLLHKQVSQERLKEAMVDCAGMCKSAKEELKELKQLANKAASKASAK